VGRHGADLFLVSDAQTSLLGRRSAPAGLHACTQQPTADFDNPATYFFLKKRRRGLYFH
jgi:hypothetical protein